MPDQGCPELPAIKLLGSQDVYVRERKRVCVFCHELWPHMYSVSVGEKGKDQDFSQVSLSPLLSPYEPLSSKGMKTIEHSIANLVFPQCCKAYAKEKGTVCLGCSRHTSLWNISPASCCRQKLTFQGRWRLMSRPVLKSSSLVAQRLCLLTSSQVPEMDHFCISPRLRLSPCPTREQINDFCSFDSVSKLSFNYKKDYPKLKKKKRKKRCHIYIVEKHIDMSISNRHG